MKILTAQQMREIDRLTVERCGIQYDTLMETAGSRVVDAIIETYGSVEDKLFWIFCGKGNNGGDGAVIARLLWMRGARVRLKLLGRLDDVSGEAKKNLETAKQIAISGPRMIFDIVEGESFHSPLTDDMERRLYSRPDFIVDAIFGTGLARPAEGLAAMTIEGVNEYQETNNLKIIAVDIPSGLPSDTGQPIGPHLKADLTVTFTAPKIANVLPPSCYANGKLVIASIGTPNYLVEEESGSRLHLVEESQIKAWLKKSLRPADAHKGSAGDVLLIAGSRGKTGAAALASETVLRAGAGLVTVATAESAQRLLIAQTKPEVMTETLDEIPSGAISHSAVDLALLLANKRTVLAIGPGLSSSDQSTQRFVREFVERRTAPIVIDADGLNALAPWPQGLKGSDELPIIITPHPGEMARLTNTANWMVVNDRIGAAREFAEKNHVTVILKGSRTIIAAPNSEVFINPTGNAGMATAGSGDVLTGLTAGLMAQCPQEPLQASIAAVYLHGLAGDIAATKLGMRSLIASDIIENLSEAVLRIGGDEERGLINAISTI